MRPGGRPSSAPAVRSIPSNAVGTGSASASLGHEDTGLQVRRSWQRRFGAGEVVYDVGEAAERVYVVQVGEVELLRPHEDGPRLVARLGAGEMFGEQDVLLGSARSGRAVVVADAELLELDRATFETMCLERPEIGLRIIGRLGARILELESRLAELGAPDLLRPVVRTLLRRAERGASETRVPLTLRCLAGDTGLSLLECHRALERLFQRKLIRLADEVLLVPDLEALAASLDD